jgi:hypothetical protein
VIESRRQAPAFDESPASGQIDPHAAQATAAADEVCR